jgi:hypothetical protein
MTTSTTTRPLLALACCGALLAACGAAPKTSGHTTTGTGTTGHASPSPSPSGFGGASNVTVDRAFWYEEFKVTVTTATVGFVANQPSYDVNPRLSLGMTMENIGPDTHTFQPEMNVSSAGNSFTSPQYNLPAVPGGQKQDGSVVFVINNRFSLSDAVLTVGSARMEQAMVPLGKSTAGYASQEPQPFPLSGNLTVGSMTLSMTGGVFAADKDYYNDADAGHLVLTVKYSATRTKEKGRNAMSADVFFLKLPDGTAVPALDGSSSPALPAGTTKQDLIVRFDVKKPVDGAYDLVVKGPFGDTYDTVQGDLQFNVSLGSGGTQPSPSVPSSDAFSPQAQPTPSGH